jgi:TPR repeat protein
MKYILVLLSIIFFFTGCLNTPETKPSLKKYSMFTSFDYSQEAIIFFEKEFQNILQTNDKNILKQYLSIYKQNANYFINSKQKIELLEKKFVLLKTTTDENSDLFLLEQAKISSKRDAIKIYKKLANKNNIKAQRELVEIYKYLNPKESLKWLKKLVQNNDIKSMKEYASANIYMIKPIQTQNIKEAVITYEKLAKMGELSSMMRLGNIYEYGYHKPTIKKDKQKALKYYIQAANKDYENAQIKLIKIYSCKKCKGNRFNLQKANDIKKELEYNEFLRR